MKTLIIFLVGFIGLAWISLFFYALMNLPESQDETNQEDKK
jgi:hypothetical protein